MKMHRTRAHIHRPRTVGERAADAVAGAMGSWTFIIAQSIVVGGWIALNLIGTVLRWDALRAKRLVSAFLMERTPIAKTVRTVRSLSCAAHDAAKIVARPLARAVQHLMLRIRDDAKVLYRVVRLVTVNVVNVFIATQGAAKMLLHDMAVFENLPSLAGDEYVAIRHNRPRIFPERVVFAALRESLTAMRTILAAAAINVRLLCKEFFAALQAHARHGTLGGHRKLILSGVRPRRAYNTAGASIRLTYSTALAYCDQGKRGCHASAS